MDFIYFLGLVNQCVIYFNLKNKYHLWVYSLIMFAYKKIYYSTLYMEWISMALYKMKMCSKERDNEDTVYCEAIWPLLGGQMLLLGKQTI